MNHNKLPPQKMNEHQRVETYDYMTDEYIERERERERERESALGFLSFFTDILFLFILFYLAGPP